MLEADKFANVSPEYSGRFMEFCHHANKQTDRTTSVKSIFRENSRKVTDGFRYFPWGLRLELG